MPKELTYLEAIREALAEERRRDPKVLVLGEDVGAYGGAFGVTQGLYDEFGEMRVIDTPISESAIIGVSIGASLRGYLPVAARCRSSCARRAAATSAAGSTTRRIRKRGSCTGRA